MANYIEYGVFILLCITTLFLAYRYPTFRKKVIDEIKQFEPQIVMAAYNKLPSDIKSKIDSKNFADIISLGLEVGQEILDEELNKSNSQDVQGKKE
jgi:hypothetical protein